MPSHDHGHDHAPHGESHDHGRDHAEAPDPRCDPGHDHGHSHAHDHTRRVAPARLAIVLALQFVYMLVELAGGFWTGSLALIADAGHMAADVMALGMVLVAARIAQRPATATQTYGWRRAEVLAAIANAAALFAVGGGIVVEGVSRFSDPHPVVALPMMGIAAGGLLVNLLGLAAMGTPGHGDLNARGAWLHLISDALGSIGAILAAGVIWKLGWLWADPAVSLLVSVLVLRSAWGLMKDGTTVLMESAPAHIDVDGLRAALLAECGVTAVHDLHVWMIAWGDVALSGHVVTSDATPDLLHRLYGVVGEKTGITHITLQLEPPGFREAETHV